MLKNMYRYPFRRRHSGFTLVELLVVILVIGILFAILMPAIGRLRARSQEVNAASAAATLRDAILQYHFEYGAWPLDYGALAPGQGEAVFQDDNYKVLAYLDINHQNNKKEILFLTQKQGAAPPVFDEYTQDTDGNIIDPWGTPYRITFNLQTSASGRSVEVRSAGQDKIFGTVEYPGDDIVSR